MSIGNRALALAAGLLCAMASGVNGQNLRPEWTVEPASGGRARVVGYLYNGDIRDAANVSLRVDRLGADGAVTATYSRRVVGDVLSGGRSLFEVPVADPGANYQVIVETVDWVKECR
jgi:hypothetical protein